MKSVTALSMLARTSSALAIVIAAAVPAASLAQVADSPTNAQPGAQSAAASDPATAPQANDPATPPRAGEGPGDEIVVTGVRASLDRTPPPAY